MQKEFLENRLIVKIGDITKEDVGAIVNAANSTLLGGGGVDGAIHRAGGKQILEECRKIRKNEFPDGLPTGEAVITTGGELPAEFVIHTVGPVYGTNGGRDGELLADCYQNCLKLARKNDIETIAFPSISTGAFGYPKHEAAAISSQVIRKFLENDSKIKQIRLVFFSESGANKFLKHQAF